MIATFLGFIRGVFSRGKGGIVEAPYSFADLRSDLGVKGGIITHTGPLGDDDGREEACIPLNSLHAKRLGMDAVIPIPAGHTLDMDMAAARDQLYRRDWNT